MSEFDEYISQNLRGGTSTQPEPDRGPLLGFDPNEITVYEDMAGKGDPRHPQVTPSETFKPAIYEENVLTAIQGLDPSARDMLAVEMFMEFDGVYQSADQIFTEDGELDGYYFQQAVSRTLALAETFGPDKFGSGTGDNSEYLQVLLGDTERDHGELLQAFQARKAAIDAAKSGGGGGRVINYIDPVALMAASKDAFVKATGRRGTTAEQRAFVKQIHGLQASGATGIQVGARAEAFAQGQAPVEAGAMEYSNAAQGLMQAMGM